MKMIQGEIVDSSQKHWRRVIKTPLLTFLSSKFAGMNQIDEIHIGKTEDERFLQKFLVENGNLYNPCTDKFPKKQEDYFRTIGQYRHKWRKDYSSAFESSYYGYYKFSKDYIKITKECALRYYYGKLSFLNIATWLYRNHEFKITDDSTSIKKRFINDFRITKEELQELFDDDFDKSEDIFTNSTELLIQETIQYSEPFRLQIANLNGGESAAHLELKAYVAEHPELIGLPKSSIAYVEYPFPTGDRVDVAFQVNDNRWAVVEIELEGAIQNLIGLFQVVKYRALQLAVFKSKGIDIDVEGYLVARSIPAEVTNFANTLEIEAIEIPASSD